MNIATAITSSTITTVCVFLPLGFIAGLVLLLFTFTQVLVLGVVGFLVATKMVHLA